MHQPDIIRKPALIFAGRQRPFISALSPDANNHQVIGGLWSEFCDVAERVPGRIGREIYGVVTAGPESQRSHPDELLYLAGVLVESTDDISADLVALTIPAATFAVFRHVGPIRELEKTLQYAYGDWLPDSDYTHGQIADVERYDEHYNSERADSEMEYWISVTPQSGTLNV